MQENKKIKTIFLVPGHFNHFPSILRTKLVERLAEKYKVVVLTTPLDHPLDQASAAREQYFFHPNLEYRTLQISQPRLWRLFNGYLRLAFVREYDDLLVTQRWYYKPTNPFVVRLLIRLGSFLPKRVFKPELFTFLESILVRPSREFVELVKLHHPSLLVSATPGFSPQEAELIHCAKKYAIPTVAVDMNFDNPECFSKFLRRTDYLAAWSERTKREAEKFQHYPLERVVVAGCLRFDHHFINLKSGKLRSREEFLKSKHLDPQKKTVVYPTPPPAAYSHSDRREIIAELVRLKQHGLLAGDPNILVRIHPSDAGKPYEDFTNIDGVHIERAGVQRNADEATKGWKTEMLMDDSVNLTETLMYADAMVSYESTVNVEFAMFDKPTIGIAFPGDRLWAFNIVHNPMMVHAGILHVAKNSKEMCVLLNKYLTHPDQDKQKYRDIVAKLVRFPDGLTHERTVDFIDKIIQHS